MIDFLVQTLNICHPQRLEIPALFSLSEQYIHIAKTMEMMQDLLALYVAMAASHARQSVTENRLSLHSGKSISK